MVDVICVSEFEDGLSGIHSFKDMIGNPIVCEPQRTGPIFQARKPVDVLVVTAFIKGAIESNAI